MALFKIFRGAEEDLNSVPLHEGYAYFCEDTGNMFIDVSSSSGGRVQLNAYAAQVLTDGSTELDVDDVFLQSMTATVAQGGTGRSTLTTNAILIGNGTSQVKLVALSSGAVAIGNSSTGVSGLSGTGALYATTSGSPTFGTLPISGGGTGASTAAAARTALEVYSQSEVNSLISDGVSIAYEVTLGTAWNGNTRSTGTECTYTYTNTALRCGKNGNVPPIITCTSNEDDYNLITSAEATVGSGILFTASDYPSEEIGLIIIDFG